MALARYAPTQGKDRLGLARGERGLTLMPETTGISSSELDGDALSGCLRYLI